MIFNGREFRDDILNDLIKRISLLDFVPEFSDILVGDNGPSVRYVNMKKNIAEKIGIKFISANLPNNTTTDDILNKIKELSSRPNMCGVIVQLPLPENIDTTQILNAVPLNLDVDGLSEAYNNLFYQNDSLDKIPFIMPTVLAIKKILDQALSQLSYTASIDKNNDLNSLKNIAIIGQGRLVGKPIFHLLKQEVKTIVTNLVDRKDFEFDIKTIDIDTNLVERNEILLNADIIITAVGKPNILTSEEIKEGVIVIDAGTLEVENVLVGDSDFENIKDKVSFITPTPGGVGPVTVACLMENITRVAQNKIK